MRRGAEKRGAGGGGGGEGGGGRRGAGARTVSLSPALPVSCRAQVGRELAPLPRSAAEPAAAPGGTAPPPGRTGRAGAWGQGTATPVRARVREVVPLPLETLKYRSGQGCWSGYQSLWRDAGAGTSLIRVVEGDAALERPFGHGQCSGVGGVVEQVPEQVPERDTGAGSPLAGDGGASCSLGVLGTGGG